MNETRRPAAVPAGFIITLAGAVLFSTKAIIVKLAFAGTSVQPLALLALRMIFALPFYLVMAAVARRREPLPRTGRHWAAIVTLGLFGYYLSSLFDFLGLQFVSAGLERLILFLYPSFAVMINFFVFRQKLSRIQFLALALTYAGILLAYLGELHLELGHPGFYKGSLLILTCAFTYAVYIAGSGRAIPVVGATTFTAYAMLAATAGVLIHFTLAGSYHDLNGQPGLWWYGLLLAVVATVVPSLLLSYGLKMIGSNNVAIISGIGPVSTILQAHYILGEQIYVQQVAGTVLVVAGVLLTGWKRKK